MSDIRQETDSLGVVEVPADKLRALRRNVPLNISALARI
jgi:hypothetical protein